jgi:hypothetical protein
VPVAPDLLKAPESFTLRGRKTGNERCALTPIVDELRCKSDSETSSKTYEKTCPEHHGTLSQNSPDRGGLRWRYSGALRCIAQLWLRDARYRRATGRLAHSGWPLFHKAKSPAPFQSIKRVDNLVSIENGYQPMHRARSVARAQCNVFPKDAPGILDGRQYDVLIRGVHGTRLLSADSI